MELRSLSRTVASRTNEWTNERTDAFFLPLFLSSFFAASISPPNREQFAAAALLDPVLQNDQGKVKQ